MTSSRSASNSFQPTGWDERVRSLPGNDGSPGVQGEPGIQGPPGEVTDAQLTSAITTTAQNPLSMSSLGILADPNYNPAQIQQIADKLDELLAVLKRP